MVAHHDVVRASDVQAITGCFQNLATCPKLILGDDFLINNKNEKIKNKWDQGRQGRNTLHCNFHRSVMQLHFKSLVSEEFMTGV